MIESSSNSRYGLDSEYCKRLYCKRGVDHYSILNILYIWQHSADKVQPVHGASGIHSKQAPSVPRSTEMSAPGGRGEHHVGSSLKGKLS